MNIPLIISAVLVALLSASCFVLSFFQFKEKGFLLNNAYIYASKKEREKMNKKPYYRQSAIVFLFFGIIFLIIAIYALVINVWLLFTAGVVGIVMLVYAIISTIKNETKGR